MADLPFDDEPIDGADASDPTGATADEPAGDGIGPLVDEARKLFGVVQQWAQRTMPEPPSGHGGPECQWCPLCQFASILRGEHPEVTERVVEAGTAVAGAVRALLDTAATKASPTGERGGERGGERPKPAPRVQRIRLDDDAAPDAAAADSAIHDTTTGDSGSEDRGTDDPGPRG